MQTVCVENSGVAMEWLATELRETAQEAHVLNCQRCGSVIANWLQLQIKMCLSPLLVKEVLSKKKSSQKSVSCMTS